MNEHLTREGFWRLLHGLDADGTQHKEPSGGDVVQELTLHFAPVVAAEQLVGTSYPSLPYAPEHFWWAIPGRLVVTEQSACDRFSAHGRELRWLWAQGVRSVICTISHKDTLKQYRPAGLAWTHFPVTRQAAQEDVLTRALSLLEQRIERPNELGAVAIHGDRQTTFAPALAAAFLYRSCDWPLDDALAEPSRHGMPLDIAGRRLVTATEH